MANEGFYFAVAASAVTALLLVGFIVGTRERRSAARSGRRPDPVLDIQAKLSGGRYVVTAMLLTIGVPIASFYLGSLNVVDIVILGLAISLLVRNVILIIEGNRSLRTLTTNAPLTRVKM